MAIIEKARGNLPAKPVKQVKKAASSAVSKPVKDDYDEPEPAKSRPVSAALSDSGDAKPAKTVKGKGKAVSHHHLKSYIIYRLTKKYFNLDFYKANLYLLNSQKIYNFYSLSMRMIQEYISP